MLPHPSVESARHVSVPQGLNPPGFAYATVLEPTSSYVLHAWHKSEVIDGEKDGGDHTERLARRYSTPPMSKT